MEPNTLIRNEQPSDYAAVETILRQAFYNLYVPGCTEHYLAHLLRTHEDFVPELDFVLESDGEVIGSIMYTKATLTNEQGLQKQILTFGPVCIAPAHQRRGHGKRLIAHSLCRAAAMGYEAVVIFGSPANYVSSGFVCCKRHLVSTEDGRYPTAMMVRELVPNALQSHRWRYRGSPAMEFDNAEAQRYDDALPERLEKRVLPSQEEFFILSHSFVE